MDEEREHRAKLRKEYTRRKRLLEVRKARQGDNAPPELDIELDELNASLSLLDLADAPKPTAEARASIGSESILDLVVAQVGKFGERLTGVEEQGKRTEESLRAGQQEAAAWREEHGKAHNADAVARARGQHVRIAVEVLIIAAFILFYLATRGP